jgi:proteic killer suppression protein
MTYNVPVDKVSFIKVKKTLKIIPAHILRNLQRWAMQVEMLGINEVRKIPGYHDEPLKGKRKKQRSIRLSRAYRAIYTEYKSEGINTISIEEINKHEY